MRHTWSDKLGYLPAGGLPKVLSQLYRLHRQQAESVQVQACTAGVHCLQSLLVSDQLVFDGSGLSNPSKRTWQGHQKYRPVKGSLLLARKRLLLTSRRHGRVKKSGAMCSSLLLISKVHTTT